MNGRPDMGEGGGRRSSDGNSYSKRQKVDPGTWPFCFLSAHFFLSAPFVCVFSAACLLSSVLRREV